MNAHILVPLDGSPIAARTLPYAESLARTLGGRLTLLELTHGDHPSECAALQLDRLANAARLRGLRAEVRLQPAAPDETARAIVEAADELEADLIAMSTHGRGAIRRLLLGSVADGVLRQARVPVLVVPPGCDRPWDERGPRCILVALDGSKLAEAVLGQVAALAGTLGTELILLQVVHGFSKDPHDRFVEYNRAEAERYLEEVRRGLRVPAEVVDLYGVDHPTEAVIADFARERGVDLLAMGTHGRGGLARFVLGSVATGAVQRSHAPLLLVRATAVDG